MLWIVSISVAICCTSCINLSALSHNCTVLIASVTTVFSLYATAPVPSLNATVHFADCYIYVNCTLALDSDSDCEIQYSIGNSTPNNVTGPLNQLVQLPLLDPNTTYNLQFSSGVNAIARERTSSTFITGECMRVVA